MILDEDVPHQLRRALMPRHDVATTSYLGWAGVKNGALLKLIDAAGFQVFVTGDKNLESQQEIAGRAFGFVVLSTVRWKLIRDHVLEIANAVDIAKPGAVTEVQCGRFVPSKFRKPTV